MTNNQTNIIEIFSSIQGEGPYIGYRQIFARFALCNLNCDYCDTSFQPQEFANIEICPGSASFKKVENPITTDQLIYEIDRLNYFHHHNLSLTGGEPLLSSSFLDNFITEYRNKTETSSLKIYLETNGTLYQELEKIIDKIDIVSMDFKLESSYGKTAPWDKHKKFLAVAQKNKKEIFAKIVVTSKISPDEIADILDIAASLDEEIPIILQPISSLNKELIPDPIKLLNIQEALLRKLTDVRIIPQMHKQMNVL